MRRPLFVILAAGLALASCAGPLRERANERSSTSSAAAVATTTKASTTTVPPAADCDAAGTPLVAGQFTLTSGGEEREYMLALPATLDPAKPTRVILNFHGSGSNMVEQAAYSQLPEQGTARDYVVVTPQGTGKPRGWQLGGGKDDVFVDDLLAALDAGACVDRSHVFATGISNGSAYSALMACRAPYRIAAVGMVAATLPSACPADHLIPAVAFHGTADPIVPFTGGEVTSEGANGVAAPGAEGAIAKWAATNGCDATPTDRAFAADVVWREWSGCTDDKSVQFYRIEGGGHTWPGGIDVTKIGITHLGATTQSVSATKVILDFFDNY